MKYRIFQPAIPDQLSGDIVRSIPDGARATCRAMGINFNVFSSPAFCPCIALTLPLSVLCLY